MQDLNRDAAAIETQLRESVRQLNLRVLSVLILSIFLSQQQTKLSALRSTMEQANSSVLIAEWKKERDEKEQLLGIQ